MLFKSSFLAVAFLFLVTSFAANAQATWTQFDGPHSGGMRGVSTYKDWLYMFSDEKGVFESADGGNSWTAILPEMPGINSLHGVDTALLIGTDRLYSYSRSGKPAYAVSQQVDDVIYDIHVVNGILYCIGKYGFYQYDESTMTLKLRNEGLEELFKFDFGNRSVFSIGTTLFAEGNGLFKSVDEGVSWQAVTNNESQLKTAVVDQNGVLYAHDSNQLYQSEDKGETWKDISYNHPSTVWNIVVTQSDIFTVENDRIYRCTKGDEDWVTVSESVLLPKLFSVGNAVFLSNEFQILQWNKTTNMFVPSNRGLNYSNVQAIEFFDNKVYSAPRHELHVRRNGENNWQSLPALADHIIVEIVPHGNKLFFAGNKGLLYTEPGKPVYQCSNGLTDAMLLDFDVVGNTMYTAGEVGVHVSRNGGISWKALPNTRSPFNEIAFVAADNDILMSGNDTGLFRILPDSSDWEEIEFFTDQDIGTLSVVDGIVYASKVDGNLFRSADNGETWLDVGIPLAERMKMIQRGDYIYATSSSSNKIYYSVDNGLTWKLSEETGLPDANINYLKEGGDGFYIGTKGRGIWKRPYLSSVEVSSDVYVIHGNTIYNVPQGTTLGEFKSKITPDPGVSVVKNMAASGGTEDILNHGDEVLIIAENKEDKKAFKISSEATVTSVDPLLESVISVHPVPAKNYLKLTNAERVTSYVIYTYDGRSIAAADLNDEQIDVSRLPAGFYFLAVNNLSGKRRVIKFVKE